MLWLCISLPQLPLEAMTCTEDERAKVVTAMDRSARWVICCNRNAERAGLKPMMNYTVALAIAPACEMLERNVNAEQEALRRLAGWAYQFSAKVIIGEAHADFRHTHRSCVWLEIGASLKLFGGFRKLIEQLEKELQPLRYTYQLGVAPTLEGAALLAHAGIRIAATNTHTLRTHLCDLPIPLLPLPSETPQQLAMAGVRNVGLLLELPRDGVAKRFGPEVSRYLDRLIGVAADPRPAFELPLEYEARFDFEAEVSGAQGLLFTLQRLVREFTGFLRARDTGVQHFTVELEHRGLKSTQLHIGLSTPDRNADRFFSLLRERIDRTALPASTTSVKLYARQFATPTALQPEMFSGALQQEETLSHTIDRINARLGDAHVFGVKVVADHRPERSWTETAPLEKQFSPKLFDRPLWLLPEPQPLSALPQIASGPERIEGGWWDGGDVERDYFVARTNAGADLWIFKDRKDHAWYLHGFWS